MYIFYSLILCVDDPNNACTIIGGVPYCVAGTGTIGSTSSTASTNAPQCASGVTHTVVSGGNDNCY